jgi:hypothetical protein
VTLLPRHHPSCALRGKVSPMSPEYGVTYLSGRTQNTQNRLNAAGAGGLQVTLR